MDTENKKAWVHILIGDGSTCLIQLNALPIDPKSDIHPIEIQFLEDVSLEVNKSFAKSAFAAYFYLSKQQWIVPVNRYAFLCQVKDELGKDVLDKFVGRSLELPVALALITRIIEISNIVKTPNHITIGATGVIADVAEGTIEPVDFLEKKLIGAVDALDSESVIFFPSDNQYEPVQEIKEKAQSKNITLFPVKDIDQTVKMIFPVFPAWKKPAKKILGILLIVLMMYSLCYALSASLINVCFEYGMYRTAEKYLTAAQYIFFPSRRLSELRKDFENKIDLLVLFIYVPQKGPTQTYTSSSLISPVLNRNDSFALDVKLYSRRSTGIYLYIFQVDESGKIRIINETDSSYSNKTVAVENAAAFRFPPHAYQTYLPTGTGGKVETYIIASAWKCRDIEAILSDSIPKIEQIRKRATEIQKFRKGPIACEKIEYEQIINGK